MFVVWIQPTNPVHDNDMLSTESDIECAALKHIIIMTEVLAELHGGHLGISKTR